MRRSATVQLLHLGRCNSQIISSFSPTISRSINTQSLSCSRKMVYTLQRADTAGPHVCTPRVTETSRISRSITTHGPRYMWNNQETSVTKKQLNRTSEHVITDVAETSNKILEVYWTSKEKDLYPYVWMRDNCQCSDCFHPIAKTRTIGAISLAMDIHPKNIQVLNGGEDVEITWSDGHLSIYPATWLNERAFNKSRQRKPRPAFRLKRSYWGSDLLENLPCASFHEILADDKAFLAWLQQLEIYGFVVLTNAPKETGQVRRLADRIAFIKKTHYGEDFEVKLKDDPSNVAYSSGPLYLHADLPYYEYKPGVQFIHCIVQYSGEGGESQIADGAHVARELNRLHPDKYRILTETKVDWVDIGNDEGRDFYKILQQPMICTNSDGDITRINFSTPQRDSFFSQINVNQVTDWYDAMKTFHDMLYDPAYCIYFKMQPGSILTFDNLRIVHGRTGYESGVGERHIQGCYVDWDEVRSMRRVLEAKFGNFEEN